MSSKKVKIADLKANLSRHLHDVRAGQSITILDRNTPVAVIVAYSQGAIGGVEVRLPVEDPNKLRKLRSPLKSSRRSVKTSSLEILEELRGDSLL